MNYLAHFHLAGNQPEWLVGGLLGDYVKGPLRGRLPAAIELGITLHRRIDHFTGGQPMTATIAHRLPTQYRRFAGILQDVMCDHFLGRSWHRFDNRPLPAYAAAVYDSLRQQRDWLPPAAARFSARMEQHDLLCRYADWDTVAATLASIGRRLRRANQMHLAAAELANHLPELESVFMDSYPVIMDYAQRQRELLAAGSSAQPGEDPI